jgi:hypothetical protein
VGNSAERVRRLCADAVIRVRDIRIERACWEGVLREIHTLTPFIEGHEPPFAYFTGCSFSEARALAVRLSAQIGEGEHRAVARLAAIRSAQGHVLQIRSRRWTAFLRRFDVERLAELGFSEDMLEQLSLFGYATLDGASRLSARQMQAQFGEEGLRLYAMLHPEPGERIPLYVPPPYIEVWHEYDEPVDAEPAMLEPVLASVIGRAAGKLGALRCQRLRVGIEAEKAAEPRWSERVLSSPHGDAGSLLSLAKPLLESLLEPGVSIDRLVVQLGSLRSPSFHQRGLFDERPAVLGAVRNVHRRYPGFIRRAVLEEHALFEEEAVVLEKYEDDADAA